MTEPPSYIDGAELLEVVKDDLSLISASVPLESNVQKKRPAHLAIGMYLHDDSVVLFTCNHDWEAVKAEPFNTLFEAFKVAQERFTKRLQWTRVTESDR